MRSLYLSLFALAVTLCLAETASAQLSPDPQRGPLITGVLAFSPERR